MVDPQPGFSTATVAGNFAYLSSVPASADQDVAAAVQQVFNFFNTTLASLGATLDNVVRVTAYLEEISEFGAMNSAYVPYFPENPPARSTIQVSNPGQGSPVAFDVVAYLPNGAAASA